MYLMIKVLNSFKYVKPFRLVYEKQQLMIIFIFPYAAY